MNTKPQKKRHSLPGQNSLKSGQFNQALTNPDYAIMLAAIVTQFEHLEDHFAFLIAPLAGTDVMTATVMLRAIKSPRGRIDLALKLLEQAARNIDRNELFDEAIKEFSACGGLRNKYVHGRWLTSTPDGEVYFAATADDGFEIMRYKKLSKEHLRYALLRIQRAHQLISAAIVTDALPGQKQELPPLPPEPKNP